jgi:hypothetical protein
MRCRLIITQTVQTDCVCGSGAWPKIMVATVRIIMGVAFYERTALRRHVAFVQVVPVSLMRYVTTIVQTN